MKVSGLCRIAQAMKRANFCHVSKVYQSTFPLLASTLKLGFNLGRLALSSRWASLGTIER